MTRHSGAPAEAQPLLPAMKGWLLLDSLLVFITGVQLFVLSAATDRFFAWTINPPLTAAFLGAAYWASLPLVFLSARERVWARARLAVFGVLAFTAITLAVTLLHLDRFHLDSFFGWAWIVVYVIVPPALVVLLAIQLRVPGGDPPRLAPLPGWLRGSLLLQAGLLLLLGVSLLAAPAVAGRLWPWLLTPLTGRAIGAWLVGMGIVAAQQAWENDFTRIHAAGAGFAWLGALQLAAVLRYAGARLPDGGPPVIDWAGPAAWVYVLFWVSVLAVGVAGWTSGRTRSRSPAADPHQV